MSAAQLIGPVAVERDADGWWEHPGVPEFDEDLAAFEAWLVEQGLELVQQSMEIDLIEHRYWTEDSGSCEGWEPAPPAGAGWFLLGIFDTEEGPYVNWVRRVAAGAVSA